MNKFNGCEISAATALEDLFIINIGTISKKLTNLDSSTNKGIKMHLDGEFVVLEITNKVGKKVTELVPVTFFKQITPIIK